MVQPIALLFPGQGAQAVGMGLVLAERYEAVARWYERAEEAAELPLRRILSEGPEEELRRTEILQPTLLTVEIGAWLALREETSACVLAAAGHSLGEYAALAAAGAIEPEQAVALVRKRGRYMQEAVPENVGGMAAVLGLDADLVAGICAQTSTDEARVWLSNDNCPGQMVVSGHLAAIENATPALKEAGARRVMPLKVSAPFHCPLMQPAAERLAADLASLHYREPAFPVFANYTAAPYAAAEQIAQGLIGQVVAPVRFRETLLKLAEMGATKALEFGPGTVLTGLAKRTAETIEVFKAETPEEILKLAEELA